MLSFVFVLPLHAYSSFFTSRSIDVRGDIESEGYAAINQIELAADALSENDPASAIEKFQEANVHFEAAEEKISKVNLLIGGLVKILPNTGKTYQAGKDLITAGANLSEAAELFSRGLVAAADEQSGSLITKIEIAEAYVAEALPSLEQADELISGIEVSALPTENQAAFTEIKNSLPKAKEAFSDFLSYADVIKEILGADYQKRYLLVFQNNTEIRPSGGFIGSFAEIDVYRGEVRKIDVPKGGSYDLQGSLSEYVAPPKPIQLINSRWEFQDANWFPDFPTTAEKLIWFYEQSGGPTVDGVIALNATHVADLLNYTGSVEMDEYGRTIDSENFVFETQKIVELEYDKIENNPKQFIGDLAPVLAERILEAEPETFIQILSHLREGLDNKDIQIYLTSDELENRVKDLGWAGEIKSNKSDFLMIVDANLGGGKTDGVITQDANLVVDIQSDGSIINTLSIKRTHNGIKNELFSGVNNVDYIRIYTPRGSELINVAGQKPPDDLLFEEPIFDFPADEDLEIVSGRITQDPKSDTYINQEFGKTVFGNWIQTKPGESSTITFTYKLPFKADILENQPSFYNKLKTAFGFSDTYDYSLQVQKQSGIVSRNLDINISYPNNFDLLWTNGQEDDKSISSIINNSDSYLSALFERRY